MSRKLSEVEVSQDNRVIIVRTIKNYKISPSLFNTIIDELQKSRTLEDFVRLIKKKFEMENQPKNYVYSEEENKLVECMNAVLKQFGFKEEF